MRAIVFLLAFALLPSAALAQPDQPQSLDQKLRDPETAARIDRALQSMTGALLDMKIGSVKATIDGREPTADERKMTIRELERRKGHSDADLDRQIAAAGPAIARGLNALADALPALTKGLDDAQRAVERAVANMPDPNYPRR
jgi:hypothetical protein